MCITMYSCNQCLENNWKYEYIDGWIRATCQMCSFEVEFLSRRQKKFLRGDKIKEGATVTYEMNNGRAFSGGVEYALFVNNKQHYKILPRENRKTNWFLVGSDGLIKKTRITTNL
jgi:hypothetical protein